jgi:hypothetical protein
LPAILALHREGVTLEILVSKRDRIGKYTRFRIVRERRR